MAITTLSGERLRYDTAMSLRLQGDEKIRSPEMISAALRRAAGYLTPCPRRALMATVVSALSLLDNADGFEPFVVEVLNGLIAIRDLIEAPTIDPTEQRGFLVYRAPMSFVRTGERAVLLGVRKDDVEAFASADEFALERIGHVRFVRPSEGQAAANLGPLLVQAGLVEIPLNVWLKAPRDRTPADLIATLDRHLEAAELTVGLPDLRILDGSRSPRHYQNRWVSPTGQTGMFVGRRPRAYGAEFWVYVELLRGQAVRFVDLPVLEVSYDACDEAWWAQAAIDSINGTPQLFERRVDGPGRVTLNFYAPVPSWATRRWAVFGLPEDHPEGVLFARSFGNDQIDEEIKFAHQWLWLAENSRT